MGGPYAAVMFQLCTGMTLFHCNQHDDVDVNGGARH
jgi:hypothetical protein